MNPESSDDLELTPSGGMIRLEEAGLLYGPRGERGSFTRYADITHFGVGWRGFFLGTRRRAQVLRRGRFSDRDGPERLAQVLRQRIAAQPAGLAQLARMAEIEALYRSATRSWATYGVVVACLLIAWLQVSDRFVVHAGALVPGLVLHGEYWRMVTANFLHDVSVLPVHLGLNMLGILVLALLVERPLGAARTLVVIAVSAIGAMGASVLADYHSVVGASGIAAGLAGAALCLELHFAQRLPVWWRLPRRLFILLILLDGSLGFAVPAIAGWAHFGGFLLGYIATHFLAGAALVRAPLSIGVKVSAVAAALMFVLSLTSAGRLVSRDAEALAGHARDLLELAEVQAGSLNDLAWVMATESDATAQQLGPAVELAERAVEATDRANPDLLDTLAEVLFQIGRADAAIEVIDEAISIAHGEPYFREQRRRFTGERDPEDRPEPPERAWPLREHSPIPKDPGIEI